MIILDKLLDKLKTNIVNAKINNNNINKIIDNLLKSMQSICKTYSIFDQLR